ncbi:DUF1611 domain-containing protein [Streptomyces sp. ZAF1911]|uniref:DUF1611 domain-containing protein n=1 Tax=unclassified Streptomyces TaxID=2593676 RepID=UPI00237C2EB2|nr:DUF1611 domain-containing protein [Streptomyces sp. ZAF1911]MDD9380512.1 DUF1611 domain-containing protein [Streptomyces sp. ZAF1911]
MDHLKRIAILADGEITPSTAKTVTGILRYRSDRVVAVVDRDNAGRDAGEVVTGGLGAGIPIVADIAAALAFQPDAVLLGTEPTGGILPPHWRPAVLEAIGHGLDVINGLHTMLAEDEEISAAAERSGARLWDVRREPKERYVVEFHEDGKPVFEIQTHRPGSRTVLTVGTDCGIGKMTTMLEIEKEALRRGLAPAFVATGQIGTMITGRGVSIDAIMVDYVAKIIEEEVCAAVENSDLVLVEGQGALNHPRGSGGPLFLMHGSRADSLIMCHDLSRPAIKYLPDHPLPSLERAIEMHAEGASWVWPEGRCPIVGLSLITAGLSDEQAREEIAAIEAATGLPATDVVRYGAEKLLDAILAGPTA